ncbi:MAG: hypothetical protein E3K37_02440 [Candidatus Kuenenia sp.]|nr:hypothetical protein [Candidatus Kuenenia hertensis]
MPDNANLLGLPKLHLIAMQLWVAGDLRVILKEILKGRMVCMNGSK